MKYKIWTYRKCEEEALKYKTRGEFANNSGSAYAYARRKKILDEVTVHMIWGRKPSGYWIYERCKKEASKYQTRNEFRIKSGSAYDRALKNKWIDDICVHMKIVGNRKKRCIYSYEFSDKHVYVGLTHNIEERQKVRDNNINDSVTKYKESTNLIPKRIKLTKYLDVNIASELEGKFLKKYINDGWIILNKRKTGGIGGDYCRWTKENCILIAKNCNSKKEFYSKHGSAYNSALRNEWISEIYKIFNSIPQKRNYYTFDYCKNEVLKYKTKKEFKENNRGAYEASLRNLWHDKICEHMIHKNIIWTKENCKKIVAICGNKLDFRKKYGSAYNSAWRNGWLNELFKKYERND